MTATEPEPPTFPVEPLDWTKSDVASCPLEDLLALVRGHEERAAGVPTVYGGSLVLRLVEQVEEHRDAITFDKAGLDARDRHQRAAERHRLADLFERDADKLTGFSTDGLTPEFVSYLLRLDHGT